LIVARWPDVSNVAVDHAAAAETDWLIRLITEIRSVRTELNVPPSQRLRLLHEGASAETQNRLNRNFQSLVRMARLGTIDPLQGATPKGVAQVVLDEATFFLPLEGVIDLDAERARLTKAIGAAEKERDSLAGRLNNPSFVERAKPEAVEKARADHAEKAAEAERLTAALKRLG